MVFGDWKDELVVVISCEINRLDNAKLVSNATRIRYKRNSLCWLPRSTSK